MRTTPAIALMAFGCLIAGGALSSESGAPTAKLRIRSDHPGDLWQYRTYRDGANCKGISPPAPVKEAFEIKAGEPFTFFVSAASSSNMFRYKYCWTNVTFTPAEGKSYIARFSFGDKNCGIDVIEAPNEGRESQAPVDILLRAYKPPFLQSGSWCGKRIDARPFLSSER